MTHGTGQAHENAPQAETSAGWVKCNQNPVLGSALGTCFDAALLKDGDVFRMWFSWRPKASIALVEGRDGVHWGEPEIVLGPEPSTGWEDGINRPSVLKRPDGYHMWYTGQTKDRSWIGHATSPDGRAWTRTGRQPVVVPEEAWEKVAVMCPHVIWDETARSYRMYYSGGDQYEPNAIGLAVSRDGRVWEKHKDNPIFTPDANALWERHKATACCVVPDGGWHLMFYIGFRDEHGAQIGLARSQDGVSAWERHPHNPIIRPGPNRWDGDAVYKPVVLLDGGRWLLWYNGRNGSMEQMGLAIHEGVDLGF